MNIFKIFTKKDYYSMVYLVLILTIIDQIIKTWIINNIILNYGFIEVLPFLELRYIINTGVSFSFLAGFDYRLIAILSFFAMLFSIYLIIGIYKNKSIELSLCISLIISGALGNLIDRLVHKGVVDYFHLYYNNYSFPVFNFADCLITICGVIIAKNILFKRNIK